jgi:hypothetical protein
MKTFEATAFMRELKILLEISIVQDSIDFSTSRLWYTYIDWEDSRMWLIDINRHKIYCYN